MPGVIMENGDRHASHTNHDRDRLPNGINGGAYEDRIQDKGKGKAEPQQNVTPTSPTAPNGLNGTFGAASDAARTLDNGQIPADLQAKFNQLPPEIAHITDGFLPLSKLLMRLAEKTHHALSNKILQLASMPIPASALHVGPSGMTEVDDTSPENLAKKKVLLEFAQSTHADWVKALVITSWARRNEDVSKLIDLKVYMDQQKWQYDHAINEMALIKRDLARARVPNPDLKTALQVLSTGKAPWMPELNYIEPPPLTPQDLLKTLENLNTLLSIRLNLHEYDKIPLQFKKYVIKSGRVTFRVAGEFELDLTIADEAPESQFWFIDFRFLFSPSLLEIPYALRVHIERRVNAVLLSDGLSGCYNLLHELVLTHKISEFRRQANQLARGKWIEGLKVEALNRSLSIQYWVDRYGKQGPKSWILLGVHSGRRKDGRPNPKATSHISLRWFRDGKEVKDAEIPIDSVNISAEKLLKLVIAKHVNHILTVTYNELDSRPLFADGEASLSLSTSSDEPAESFLKVQLTSQEHLSVNLEPITGRFIFSPATMIIARMEAEFNGKSKDPVKDAHGYIETVRYRIVEFEIVSHAISVGWQKMNQPAPISEELMKKSFPKGTAQLAWFRRPSWKKDWYMVVSFSMSGELWWLIEIAPTAAPGTPPKPMEILTRLRIPIKATLPIPTYDFLSTLNLFAAALLFHYTNLKALHTIGSRHAVRNTKFGGAFKIPSIFMSLSNILPSKNKSPRTGKPWAKDVVKLAFFGLEASRTRVIGSNIATPVAQTPAQNPPRPTTIEQAVMVTEARLIVDSRQSLSFLGESFDQDIAFDKETGAFAIRIRSIVGEPVITTLVDRFNRVERFVDFIGVLDKYKGTLHADKPSLTRIAFSYGPSMASPPKVIGAYQAIVNFGVANKPIGLVFGKGNPHLRIADNLSKVLNSPRGLDGVASILPLTLPALRALDTIEAVWASFTERGEPLVFVRAAEWYIVRYNLLCPPADGTSEPINRRVSFEIRMQNRKGEAWWCIRRNDKRDDKTQDQVDMALKPIWDAVVTSWLGMRVSAVAKAGAVEELIGEVDKVVRGMDWSKPLPVPVPVQEATVSTNVKIQQTAPVAMMQQPQQQQVQAQKQQRPQMQQQRQQPTPNQSQSQSQSQNSSQSQRGNPLKREIVEIFD